MNLYNIYIAPKNMENVEYDTPILFAKNVDGSITETDSSYSVILNEKYIVNNNDLLSIFGYKVDKNGIVVNIVNDKKSEFALIFETLNNKKIICYDCIADIKNYLITFNAKPIEINNDNILKVELDRSIVGDEIYCKNKVIFPDFTPKVGNIRASNKSSQEITLSWN